MSHANVALFGRDAPRTRSGVAMLVLSCFLPLPLGWIFPSCKACSTVYPHPLDMMLLTAIVLVTSITHSRYGRYTRYF